MDSYYRRNQQPHHEHHRRRLHLKLIVVLIVLVYCTYCLFRPIDALTLNILPATNNPNPSPTLDWPADAEAAIGTTSYGLLASSFKTEIPMPTASVAKLITALTVLNKFPLGLGQQGPSLTLGPTDVALFNKYYAENGSVVKIQPSEQLTEYEALEAMLIPSGNNIADSLAIWAFGSLGEYKLAAENEVNLLGMDHTTMGSDASGFDPSTTSTPSDLIKLARAVMANPLLTQIVNEEAAIVPVAGEIKNTNYLLGTSGIIGIKTGNSEQAGGNLVFAANYNLGGQTTTIIGAIMHAPQLVDAMKAATPLLVSVEKNIQIKTISVAGQTVANYTAPWLGSPISIVSQKDLVFPTWVSQAPSQSLKANSYKAPRLISNPFHSIAAGTVVGKLTIGGSDDYQTSSLVVKQQISPPSIIWRLTHPF